MAKLIEVLHFGSSGESCEFKAFLTNEGSVCVQDLKTNLVLLKTDIKNWKIFSSYVNRQINGFVEEKHSIVRKELFKKKI
jgi:hypothetical protein